MDSVKQIYAQLESIPYLVLGRKLSIYDGDIFRRHRMGSLCLQVVSAQLVCKTIMI